MSANIESLRQLNLRKFGINPSFAASALLTFAISGDAAWNMFSYSKFVSEYYPEVGAYKGTRGAIERSLNELSPHPEVPIGFVTLHKSGPDLFAAEKELDIDNLLYPIYKDAAEVSSQVADLRFRMSQSHNSPEKLAGIRRDLEKEKEKVARREEQFTEAFERDPRPEQLATTAKKDGIAGFFTGLIAFIHWRRVRDNYRSQKNTCKTKAI